MTPRLLYAALLVLAAHLAFSSATVRLFALRGSGLKGDLAGRPDPYIKVWCGSSFGGMTEYYKNNANPVWHSEFYFPSCNINDNLKLEVWDKDPAKDDLLGTCYRRVESGMFVDECSFKKGRAHFNFELK